MHFTVFSTKMGYAAFVHRKPAGSTSLAVQVFLPTDRNTVTQRIKGIFPEAEKDRVGITELATLIKRFFEGEKITIPMHFVDSSVCYPLQLKVLEAERCIPRGKVATYTWVAAKAGTKSVRAAGTALARNPFPIVVPCHRAIHADGTLGQYQGGTEMKRKLLQMEGVEFDSAGRVLSTHILR
jgi:methylated-DNA-[protein]-cysteine S-methyltransferase